MDRDIMDKYEIESKICVKPTSSKLVLKIILNIVLFGIAMYTLFYTLMEGFNITKIGELCLAILVVYYYNIGAKSQYQFSILNLEIYSDKIIFVYNSSKLGTYIGSIQYVLMLKDIEKIEYSKQLHAIRFLGELTRTANEKSNTENELVVYCLSEAYQIMDSIENRLKIKTIILD